MFCLFHPLLLLMPLSSSFSSRMDLMENALLSGPPFLDCDELELALELELADGEGILTSDSGRCCWPHFILIYLKLSCGHIIYTRNRIYSSHLPQRNLLYMRIYFITD